MKKNVTLDPETEDFLALLKEPPPAPNDQITRLLIEILEEGGSLEDFYPGNCFERLISESYSLLKNIKDLASIRDSSIASNVRIELIPSFRLPKEFSEEITTYLQTFNKRRDVNNNQVKSSDILERLPYWPYVLQVLNMMRDRANSNAKRWNKRRWANTLRYLRSDDCPLGQHTKRVAIYQYRMALAYCDEFRYFPRSIEAWKRRLGLPMNERRGWKKIVQNLVVYLNPFFPSVVSRGNAKPYIYRREGERRGSLPVASKGTYQVTANILHLAYPEFWSKPSAKRVMHFYHAD
jgi:hypothetical protein